MPHSRRSSEELRNQYEDASLILGEPFLPVSQMSEEILQDILTLPHQELASRYPRRWKFYIKILRELKKPVSSLTETETLLMARQIQILNNLDAYIASQKHTEQYQLFPHQETVFEAIRAFREQGSNSGYINLPPGAGKTAVFATLIKATDMRSLVVVPSKPLMHQTEQEFHKFAPALSCGMYYGDRKTVGKEVTLTTYNSFRRATESGVFRPTDFECLILDEAHEALGRITRSVVDAYSDCFRLGLTATPDYAQNKRVLHLLGPEIASMSILEAVRIGALCGFSVILVSTKIPLDDVQISASGEYRMSQVERIVNQRGLTNAAVKIYQEMFQGKKVLAFCAGITHAHEVARAFRKAGTLAYGVDGTMTDDQQDALIQRINEENSLFLPMPNFYGAGMMILALKLFSILPPLYHGS